MAKRFGNLSALVLLVLVAAACDDSDPTGPTTDTVAGSYEATSFIAGGEDILAAGGSLTLVLGANGSVAGSLSVPESVGGPLTADMAGTFTVIGDSISIAQTADTFVRDADWSWSAGVLDGAFEESVAVRLIRQ